MEKKIRYNWARIIIIITVICAIGYALFLAKDTVSLLKENSDLKKHNKQLIEEKKELTKELKNVNTPEYIEEQAKLQLKLIRPGETLFILGDGSTVPKGVTPSTDKENNSREKREQGSDEGTPGNTDPENPANTNNHENRNRDESSPGQ